MTDVNERLSDCLVCAGTSFGEISASTHNNDDGRLHWLQMQLSNVISELSAILADIKSGLSFGEMGLAFGSDANELVEGFEREVASLRGQITSLLMTRSLGK